MRLADIIAGLTGQQVEASPLISHAVIDSRQATENALFVALPGEQTDGHHFVEDAFRRGAMVAIVDRAVDILIDHTVIQADSFDGRDLNFDRPLCIQVADSLSGLQQLATFWRNQFETRVIGLTGSVGKSSTKELAAAVLEQRFNVLKSSGNLNNEIGLPLTLLQLNEAHERVILEMGMYDLGEITLLCQIAQPEVGVITNVGPTHLERLGTVERIAQAKSELVQALPNQGVAILNQDDARVLAMAALTSANVMTYGLSPEADLWASDVTSTGLEGTRFALNYGEESMHVKVPLLGRHSVHTALRAALIGLVEGLAWEEIIAGLQSSSAQLRLVAVSGPNQSILLDDTYNASPTSTIAALNLLDDLAAARKIAVLGCMAELGQQEESGHRKVGCRAAQTVDLLITVGSRTEYMAEEAKSCGLEAEQILYLENNQAAIDYLRGILTTDDVVLIKGSRSLGMEEIVSALTEPKQQ